MKSLSQIAFGGALWTAFGYGIRQLLRFGANLILTRLLFPDLFGLMTLINLFILGLNLFSDIGINPAIIQNRHGTEKPFLNTAWTLQIGRGFALWFISLLLAWPVAQIYQEPILLYALPVSAFVTVIGGFNSTRIAEANRRLQLGRLVIIELASYILGLIVMMIWAWYSPTIWALISGGLATAVTELILSHLALRGEKNSLAWHKPYATQIFRFGRWIFISTALTFLADQSDRLIIGRLIDLNFLGIYTIAFALASLPNQMIRQLGYRILFPSYAKFYHEDKKALYKFLRRSRLLLIGVTAAISIPLAIGGPLIIDTLYDPRYNTAGAMLTILAAGMLFNALGNSYDNLLVALGKSNQVALIMGTQFVIQLSGMLLGLHFGDELGLLIALSLTGLFAYPLRAYLVAQEKFWQKEVDIPLLLAAILFWLLMISFVKSL